VENNSQKKAKVTCLSNFLVSYGRPEAHNVLSSHLYHLIYHPSILDGMVMGACKTRLTGCARTIS
jgi:hypothetical protein